MGCVLRRCCNLECLVIQKVCGKVSVIRNVQKVLVLVSISCFISYLINDLSYNNLMYHQQIQQFKV